MHWVKWFYFPHPSSSFLGPTAWKFGYVFSVLQRLWLPPCSCGSRRLYLTCLGSSVASALMAKSNAENKTSSRFKCNQNFSEQPPKGPKVTECLREVVPHRLVFGPAFFKLSAPLSPAGRQIRKKCLIFQS